MDSSAIAQTREPSAEFRALFQERADPGGTMPFDRFMDLALYAPRIGYYRRAAPRIGYGPGTDFFTASTSGPIFGELVAAACCKLLGGRNPRDFTFVEIGAEAGRGILSGVPHPFGAVRTISLGEPMTLTGPCVVFSNELFDAQPFRRFVHRQGAWRELGVALRGTALAEVDWAIKPPPFLPATAPEGYTIDAPEAAASLAHQIAQQPWTGLFVAFDYGKSWRELTEASPAGTARAYFRHMQSNDLIARPGEQDLTCHICWDWIGDALTQHGFAPPAVEAHEAFFVHHAASAIEAISVAEAARFSPRKLALLQLLHPAHLGQKFQVLHTTRM